MKIRVGDLKKIVHEEYLRGVPEFVLQEASGKFVDEIRKHIKKHIMLVKRNPADVREAMDSANDVLNDLEQEVNELLEQKIWQFIQST